jgi:cytochrome c oxidase cbb3-type subunit I/II
MYQPDAVSAKSIMPSYPWLFEQLIDKSSTAARINALRKIGVPYGEGYESIANEELETQARGIANTLKADNIEISPDTEIVALIAYLQRLGKDIQVQKEASNQ